MLAFPTPAACGGPEAEECRHLGEVRLVAVAKRGRDRHLELGASLLHANARMTRRQAPAISRAWPPSTCTSRSGDAGTT